MSVGQVFLGLLESGPQHGYGMKASYDRWFGPARELPTGQVYSTLRRLERDGLVVVSSLESGDGPERKLYAITSDGVEELTSWLGSPQSPGDTTLGPLYAKVVVALVTGRPPEAILEEQRRVHIAYMRELRRSSERDLESRLAVDYLLAHLQADLEWIELAGQRAILGDSR
jgi:DNA-binding PadR family transcriptional regulator